MRVAIVSDMHASHWGIKRTAEMVDHVLVRIADEKPDLVVDAGDNEFDLSDLVREAPVISVKGNHDWYGMSFRPELRYDENGHKRDTSVVMSGDWLAIGCTLWTDFNRGDTGAKHVVGKAMADYRWIEGFTVDECLAEHIGDREFLKKYERYVNAARVDVVVTHHAPSRRSVHPRFDKPGVEGLLNYGIVSDLDGLVQSIAPKLWVHGHVHDTVDYHVGQTRVVAWPCGYPNERRGMPKYEPLFLEI